MSEYYAEHESIEELGERVAATASEMDDNATTLTASAQRIARSQTLDSLGYSNLTRRTQASVSKLSGKVKDISNVLGTVSALYADYEGRVISALNDSVSAGNNYSRDSRHEVRSESDRQASKVIIISIYDDGKDEGGTISSAVNPTTPTNPSALTPEQKRQYVHDWLETNHPELLEQIYDRLMGTGGAATVAGLGGSVAAAAKGMTGTVGRNATQAVQAAQEQAASQQATGSADGSTGGAADGAGAVSTAPVDQGASAVDAGATPDTGADAAQATPVAGGADTGSDWVSDMLNDAVDSTPVQEAQQAVANAAEVGNPVAVSNGPASLSDSSSMDFATQDPSAFAQFMSRVGAGLVDAVHKYGVSAGILAGGAGAVYASSAVTIEAVAHCAEFVATKCMPGVHGFVSQATSAVRVTAISIRTTLSNAAQGIGGLLG